MVEKELIEIGKIQDVSESMNQLKKIKKDTLKDKALEYVEKLCLVFANSDKSNLKNVQKIIDNIYQHVHCVQENNHCYNFHEDWRKELNNQNWEI